MSATPPRTPPRSPLKRKLSLVDSPEISPTKKAKAHMDFAELESPLKLAEDLKVAASSSSPSKRKVSQVDEVETSPTKRTLRDIGAKPAVKTRPSRKMYDNNGGWEDWAPESDGTLTNRIKNMASNNQPFRPYPPSLLSLPEKITRKILNYAFDDDGRHRVEMRACFCLDQPDKVFPFRKGPAILTHDPYTNCDVVRSESECPLDMKSPCMGPWCRKQYLAHKPGKKRTIPTLAKACKRLYKDWRDITVWVFCTEFCLFNALKVLPYWNKKLMTHVRLFERSNEKNILDEKDQWGPRRESYLDGALQYEVGENQEIEYKGQRVLVKEMKLAMQGYDV